MRGYGIQLQGFFFSSSSQEWKNSLLLKSLCIKSILISKANKKVCEEKKNISVGNITSSWNIYRKLRKKRSLLINEAEGLAEPKKSVKTYLGHTQYGLVPNVVWSMALIAISDSGRDGHLLGVLVNHFFIGTPENNNNKL